MNRTFSYCHRIQYYETDGMHIVHHSNYIRWMEEARIDMMEKIGYGYDHMERDGVSIPVLGVNCKYRVSMQFGQTCRIDVRITTVSPVRISVAYEFHDAETNQLCGEATSDHCFTGANGHPLSLKKKLPDVYELFCSQLYQEETEP